MNIQRYFWLMGVGILICAIGLVLCLWFINPISTHWLGFFLFYSSVFLTSFGIWSLIGFLIRSRLFHEEWEIQRVKIALRQAFLLSVFLIFLLFLQSLRLLTLFNVAVLLCVLVLLEFFFLSIHTDGLSKDT